jgi:hypothetical protein
VVYRVKQSPVKAEAISTKCALYSSDQDDGSASIAAVAIASYGRGQPLSRRPATNLLGEEGKGFFLTSS